MEFTIIHLIVAYLTVAVVAKFDKAIGLGLCFIVTLGVFAAYSFGFLSL